MTLQLSLPSSPQSRHDPTQLAPRSRDFPFPLLGLKKLVLVTTISFFQEEDVDEREKSEQGSGGNCLVLQRIFTGGRVPVHQIRQGNHLITSPIHPSAATLRQ
jgi:hypothetical protein